MGDLQVQTPGRETISVVGGEIELRGKSDAEEKKKEGGKSQLWFSP